MEKLRESLKNREQTDPQQVNRLEEQFSSLVVTRAHLVRAHADALLVEIKAEAKAEVERVKAKYQQQALHEKEEYEQQALREKEGYEQRSAAARKEAKAEAGVNILLDDLYTMTKTLKHSFIGFIRRSRNKILPSLTVSGYGKHNSGVHQYDRPHLE
eukprot:GILK01020769.1.p1 GENE.GILK01020769.1~~GILK01020769.1.p1  ORF type:complete len:157 (-),score=28.03 GILK01020769.1:483-953(-)